MLTRGSKLRQLYPTKIVGIKLFVLDLPMNGLGVPPLDSVYNCLDLLPPGSICPYSYPFGCG
jgi:hypothetical protein